MSAGAVSGQGSQEWVDTAHKLSSEEALKAQACILPGRVGLWQVTSPTHQS